MTLTRATPSFRPYPTPGLCNKYITHGIYVVYYRMSHKKVTFKEYAPKQTTLLPQDLSELIPENHLVRVIDQIVDQLDLSDVLASYKGGGRSSYHPRMMLKVLLYAYCQQLYSCRKIAAALRESTYFMWLSGGQYPCFKTINNFRTGRMNETIKSVFGKLVWLLLEKGLIDDSVFFVDGTKFEAASNRHTPVWRKNAERYKKQAQERADAILQEVDKINQDEDAHYGSQHLPEQGEHLNGDQLKSSIDELTQQINNTVNKEQKRALSKQRTKLKNEQKKVAKYEAQEEILNGRNSYSRTDPDASFMRTKDDQLRPCYNVQISTQDQFITHFSISQSASDQAAFLGHFETLPEAHHPKAYVGDAGYGTEVNYEVLDTHHITAYLKFASYNKEQTKAHQSKLFHKDNFHYIPSEDCYICPNSRKLIFDGITYEHLHNGKQSKVLKYRCVDCSNCPFRAECLFGDGNRTISYRPKLEQYREVARQLLNSEQGEVYQRRRGADVESVFGHIKHNRAYRRLKVRGLSSVTVEFGLLAMAHNLMKMAALGQIKLFDFLVACLRLSLSTRIAQIPCLDLDPFLIRHALIIVPLRSKA